MSQHRIIWGIAALAVLCATAVGLWRYRADIWSNYGGGPGHRLTRALRMLDQDPSQIQNATREAVRAVAVDVAANETDSAEGRLMLALQLQREKNFDGAEANFRRAISLRPDWSWPHMALGRLLTRQTEARRGEAEEELRKAITLAPDWGRPHDNLAVLLRLDATTFRTRP